MGRGRGPRIFNQWEQPLNPLVVQISIGAGAFVVGFVVATVAAGGRLRRTRANAQSQADGLQEQVAIKRLRIRELEGKLADLRPSGPSADDIAPTFQEILAKGSVGPRRLATRMDRTPDSAPPRV